MQSIVSILVIKEFNLVLKFLINCNAFKRFLYQIEVI